MKNKLAKIIGTIGTLCLACNVYFHFSGCCLLFFGEEPYPED